MPNRLQVVIAAIGSITAAVKAQRTLLSAGIAAEVVALSPQDTRKGCAYGVEISPSSEISARNVLRTAGISVSQYIKKG